MKTPIGAIAHSAKWTSISFFFLASYQLGQYLILARLLTPAELGAITAMILMAGVAEIIINVGLGTAYIQRLHPAKDDQSTLFWATIAWSFLVGLAALVAAPAIASFFHASTATDAFRLAGLTFALSGASQIPNAVLEKALKFRVIAINDSCAALLAIATCTASALAGAGVFSAPLAMLCFAVVRGTLAFRAAGRVQRFGMTFSTRRLRGYARFGGLQTVDTLLNYVGANASSFLVGRVFGPAALGGFNLAISLAVNAPTKVNPIITRVLFPVFSMIQTDVVAMRGLFLRATRICSTISAPPLVCLALIPYEAAGVIFGEQWDWVGEIIPILAVVGILRVVGNPVGFLVSATNNLKLGLTINAVKTAVLLPVLFLGSYFGGTTGAAWALLGCQIFGFVLSIYVVRRILAVKVREYVRASLAGLGYALPLGATLYVIREVLNYLGTPGALVFSVCTAAGVAIFALALAWSPDPAVRHITRGLSRRSTLPTQEPSIGVICPPTERLDGTGGAIATWITQVYVDSPLPYVVYGLGDAPKKLKVAKLPALMLAVVALRTLTRPLAKSMGKSAYSVEHRILSNGKIWVRYLSKKIQSHSVLHIHNRPDYGRRLRKAGYSGKIILHMHNDVADYVAPDQDTEILSEYDAVVFCSQFLLEKAQSSFKEFNGHVIYNGVPETATATTKADVPTLVYAGRLIEEKGPHLAIEICRRMNSSKHTRLKIIGEAGVGADHRPTPYFRQIRLAVEAVNHEFGEGTISMLGFMNHTSLMAELGSSSVFIYPCLWDEPFGMVVAESISCGTPVVAYRKGGLPEIVQPGCGTLLDPSASVDDFLEAIEGQTQSSSDNRLTPLDEEFRWPSVKIRWFQLFRGFATESEATSR